MKKLTAALIPLAFVVACGDDTTEPDDHGEEEEVITTVNVTMTAPGEMITASWRDVDGPGGNDPVITQPTALTAGSTYAVSVEILNETEMPAEDITAEIREEAEEHQLFYVLAGGVTGNVVVTDTESTYGPNMVGDDLPVGLAATITPAAAGMGTLRMTLRHLPPMNGNPVKTANTTITDGEGDFDITFDVTVQ